MVSNNWILDVNKRGAPLPMPVSASMPTQKRVTMCCLFRHTVSDSIETFYLFSPFFLEWGSQFITFLGFGLGLRVGLEVRC